MLIFSVMQRDFLSKHYLANISVIDSKIDLPLVFPARINEYNDKLYFTTLSNAKKVKYLEIDNSIGIIIVDPSGFPYLGASGTIKFIKNDESSFQMLLNKIMKKYDSNGAIPFFQDRIIIEITPKVIFGEIILNQRRTK